MKYEKPPDLRQSAFLLVQWLRPLPHPRNHWVDVISYPVIAERITSAPNTSKMIRPMVSPPTGTINSQTSLPGRPVARRRGSCGSRFPTSKGFMRNSMSLRTTTLNRQPVFQPLECSQQPSPRKPVSQDRSGRPAMCLRGWKSRLDNQPCESRLPPPQ